MKTKSHLLAVLFLLATGLKASAQPSAGVASPDAPGIAYFVDSVGDGGNVGSVNFCNDGTGHCTLRAAIQAANGHAGADGIIIDLSAGSIINLTQALPDITESVSITGPGADKLKVRRNSASDFRIFKVMATGGTVTFSGMTVSNGRSVGSGSGGGGIAIMNGTVNVLNMTISDNLGGSGGGGIYNAGVLNVTNCLITGNFGQFGGGIAQDLGSLTLKNSTIAGNSAVLGGGINLSDGSATLSNSTICLNSTDGGVGGGVATQDPLPVTKSTIIALNKSDTGTDVYGTFLSQGYNLIGVRDQPFGNSFTQPSDQTGSEAQPLDPRFDPAGLQNNGGPTRTIALLINSAAIDKGSSAGLTTDQRGSGFPRANNYSNIADASGGDGTDIGACEGTRLLITSVTRLTNAHILLQGLGMPGRAHAVEASPDLTPNSFIPFPDPITADGTGSLQFDDPPAANPTKRFYRFRFP